MKKSYSCEFRRLGFEDKDIGFLLQMSLILSGDRMHTPLEIMESMFINASRKAKVRKGRVLTIGQKRRMRQAVA